MNQLVKINAVSLYTLTMREWRRILRIWSQTVLPPIITTSLYFVIFGQIIGQRIGNVEGMSFIEYMVPGLILMAIINNAYTNVSSSFFSSKFQRNIEEILVSPTHNWVIVIGYCLGGVFRGLFVGAFVYLVSMFFVEGRIHSVSVTLAISCMTSVLFSLAGFLNGLFARKFDDVSIIPTFVLTPLIYLGGIFYNVEMLTPFWQKVTMLNPIFYMVNAMRYGMVASSDVDIATSFVVISIFILALYFIVIRLLHYGYGIRH